MNEKLRPFLFGFGFIALLVFFLSPSDAPRVDAKPRLVEARGDLAADEKSTIELFDAASPSVVYVTSIALRRSAFSLNVMEIPRGTGSGFIWDAGGFVVTNFHVVAGGESVQVTLSDQSTWRASLIGADPNNDLAVLKIDAPAEKIVPIPIGRSSDLQVGQKVFAIGNPFGLDHTLTTGVISGLGREIMAANKRPISGVIQTDAAINPGNSGGPLLDSAGRLIGINTAIASPTGAYAGVGFAVPVDTVNRIVPDLIRYGKARRPALGVTIADPYVARRLGVRRGVLIMDVLEGGAADRAGMRGTRMAPGGRVIPGDIVTSINGTVVSEVNDIYRSISASKVGDEVRLTIVREGQPTEITLRLGAA